MLGIQSHIGCYITVPNLILKIKRNGFLPGWQKPEKRKRILNERSPHSFYCDFICPLGEIYMFQYKVKLYCFQTYKSSNQLDGNYMVD